MHAVRRTAAIALAIAGALALVVAVYARQPALPPAPPVTEAVGCETTVAPGQGAILRHPSGAQLKILPGTFTGTARVRVSEEEAPPLAHRLTAPVWSLEADQDSFDRPIELVLPATHDGGRADGSVFGMYWDGTHWVRVDGVQQANGGGLRVLAHHFSLWGTGTDPDTRLGNHAVAPALLSVSLPETATAGEDVVLRYAVANLGPSDLDGHAVVSVVDLGRPTPEVLASSARIAGMDGADGSLGSTIYATDSDIARGAKRAFVVDAATVAPLAVALPDPGEARLQVRLDLYDRAGRHVGAAVTERTLTVVGDGPSGAPSPMGIPERIDVVRPPGRPLPLAADGSAREGFDAPGTFTGTSGRDVALNWGGYQAGVAARFAAAPGAGLEGTAAQSLGAHGARRVGIVRRITGMVSGEEYEINVSYLLTTDEGGSSDRARLGIDLSGGTDAAAAGVAWVEGSTTGEWTSLVMPQLVAVGDAATVFLELLDEAGDGGSQVLFDGLEVASLEARLRPDLMVEDIRVEQRLAGGCAESAASLVVTIRNAGGGRAASFNTTVGGVSGACGPWRVRGLDPGEQFLFNCPLDAPGEYNVRVVVDASNAVGEADENNNWLQRSVRVAPTCPPTPTVTPTAAASPTPLVTATATATATPEAPARASTCTDRAPLCLGSPVSVRYLGSDWTVSLDGWRAEPVAGDERWVSVTAWGTLVRAKRHEVERLIATTGDPDLGHMLTLTLVDDHGHSYVAQAAPLSGPLAVESRLLFEDVRDLWGRFTFEISRFPAPSALGLATIGIGAVPGDTGEGVPVQFQYELGDNCCGGEAAKPMGEPHFRPGVVQGPEMYVMPYLSVRLGSVEVSADGTLLSVDLVLRNDDYVTLKPAIGPALVINGDWSYAAYLGRSDQEPVNWRDAEQVWQEVSADGVPPLSARAPQPYGLRVYALAPKGATAWERPILYLPRWDKAMPLY